jgi:YVTN family beta-propeller protein
VNSFLSTYGRGRIIAAALAGGSALLLGIAPPIMIRPAQAERHSSTEEFVNYASPLELLFSPEGSNVYVLCQQSQEVRVLDAATFAQIKSISVGGVPRGMSLSSRGDRLYVTNSWDDSLSVIDTASLSVIATWHVGSEPSGVVADKEATHLFVANRLSDDISVLNAQTGEEEKRLAGGRGTSYLALAPDGGKIYATHIYPNPSSRHTGLENRTPPESEITVVDTKRATVTDRIPLHSIAGVFHLVFSHDGRLGVVATYHPKNLVPLAHLEHGGAFAYTVTLFGSVVGKPIEVPLDELDRYAAQPFAIAIAPDSSRMYISLGGSEAVLVIDIPRLLRFVNARPRPASGSYASDLAVSSNYVIARIPVGHNPRGLALSADGSRLLVANRLDDSISVIDTRKLKVTTTISLNGNEPVNVLRRGEQTFYSARHSFQSQISCSSCHIDSTFDGLTWDLEPDGFGIDVVDNRLLEDLRGTEPFKWNGGNPNIPTECGPRTEKYFWRSENYDDLTLSDLTVYVRTMRLRPNRWRMPGNELTAAQERGKVIFERSVDRFKKLIPSENQCSYCHSGPKGTSQRSFDVGTKKVSDQSGLLDTPQLSNVAMTAPYLHDGSARTMEEIWTIYNPDDKHGRTNDLTKDELNDLIEYLRTR